MIGHLTKIHHQDPLDRTTLSKCRKERNCRYTTLRSTCCHRIVHTVGNLSEIFVNQDVFELIYDPIPGELATKLINRSLVDHYFTNTSKPLSMTKYCSPGFIVLPLSSIHVSLSSEPTTYIYEEAEQRGKTADISARYISTR